MKSNTYVIVVALLSLGLPFLIFSLWLGKVLKKAILRSIIKFLENEKEYSSRSYAVEKAFTVWRYMQEFKLHSFSDLPESIKIPISKVIKSVKNGFHLKELKANYAEIYYGALEG